MKLFTIKQIETGHTLVFDNMAGIDRLIKPTFDNEGISKFFSNEDDEFRISTDVPVTLIEGEILGPIDSEVSAVLLLDHLEDFEDVKHVITAYGGAFYHLFIAASGAEAFKLEGESYRYQYFLPDFTNGVHRLYYSNDTEAYNVFSESFIRN